MLLTGNCLQLINELDNDIIQTIVTSPPYWGLRDYEGEEEQLGQEETPEKYVANMTAFFRLCKRTLKDDGTVWINIGDTYFGAKGGHWEGGNSITSDETGHNYRMHRKAPPKHKRLKTKDLCGVPWMLAFSMQKDGWYLRQDIIWHKPNPMPEAVTDRCVKSHEHIFLFSLKPRYYFDHEAIQEKAAGSQPNEEFRNKRDVWTINTAQSGEAHFAVFPTRIPELCIKAGTKEGDTVLDPFMGSGTTALVAQKLGRKWIGFELNDKYAELISRKTAQGELF